MQEARDVIESLVADGAVVYGVTTGFGALASTIDPVGRRRPAPGEPPDEPRRRRRAGRSRARSSGRCSCSGPTRWPSATAAAGRSSSTGCSISCAWASIRSCPSRGASGRPATSRRSPTWRCRSSVAARSSSAARSCRPCCALREAGLEPLTLEAKEGLALLNGTQMMSAVGALVLADADRLVRTASVVGGDERRGAARDRRRLRRRLPAGPAAPGPGRGRRRAPPPAARQRAADRPSRPRPQGPGPVLAALHPAGPRRGPRHARPPPPRPRHRAQLGDRQPARLPRRRGRRRGDASRPAAAGSSAAATSTASRSRSRSTSPRSRWPSSVRSASGGPRCSSTRVSTAACRRSWPRRPGSTRG